MAQNKASIPYTFVARDGLVLCEYTAIPGNWQATGVQCLSKCPRHNAKFTYNADRHSFNFVVHNGYIFLAVASDESNRQIPFSYIDKLKEDFLKKHGETAKTATANSLQKTYGPELKKQLEYAIAHPEEISKIAAVQAQVGEVQKVMLQNIDKVLERGEKLDTIVDKSDNLVAQADNFAKSGRDLRNRMWWNNIKMKLIIAGVLALLLMIIILVACFAGGQNNCG